MLAIPDSEAENRSWLTHRMAVAGGEGNFHHCVVVDNDLVAGFGGIEEGPEAGKYRLFIVGAPERVMGGMGVALYRYLSEWLTHFKARRVWVREESRDPVMGFFYSVGFQKESLFILPGGMEVVVAAMAWGE